MAGITKPTALIIGASNPIGVAVASYLLEHNGRVIFHGGTDREQFHADCLALRTQYGRGVQPLWIPIRTSRQFFRTVRPLLPVDCIICIYGPCLKANLHHTPPSAYRKLFDLNVALLSRVVTYCLPHLATTDYGRIIVFGADYSTTVRGYTSMALYGSSKWALASMVQSLVLEAHNPHCKGYTICPGYITDEESTATNKHHWHPQQIAQAVMRVLDRNTAVPCGIVGIDDIMQ